MKPSPSGLELLHRGDLEHRFAVPGYCLATSKFLAVICKLSNGSLDRSVINIAEAMCGMMLEEVGIKTFANASQNQYACINRDGKYDTEDFRG